MRGMTLVELMIVVAIVGVMSAVAMFALSGSSDAKGTAALARSLHFAMQRARTESAGDNKQRRIYCDPAVRKCSYQIARTIGTANVSDWDSAGGDIPWGGHARVWNITASTDNADDNSGSLMATAASIIFKPNGTATAGTIYVADTKSTARNKYKVYVYQGTGLSRMVDRW